MLPRTLPNAVKALNDLIQLINELDTVIDEYKDTDNLTGALAEASLFDLTTGGEEFAKDIYTNLIQAAKIKLTFAIEKFYSNEFKISNDNIPLVTRTISHFCTLPNTAATMLNNNIHQKTDTALFINQLLVEQNPNLTRDIILHRAICYGQPLTLIRAMHEIGYSIKGSSLLIATARASNDVIKYLITHLEAEEFAKVRKSLDNCIANQGDFGIYDENENLVIVNFVDAKVKLLKAMIELEKVGKTFSYSAADKKHSRQIFIEPICAAKTIEECFTIYDQYINAAFINYQRNTWLFASTYSETKKLFINSLQERAYQLIQNMYKGVNPAPLELFYYMEKLASHPLFSADHDNYLENICEFKSYFNGFMMQSGNLAQRNFDNEPVAYCAILNQYINSPKIKSEYPDIIHLALQPALLKAEVKLTLEAMKRESHKPMVAEYLASQGIIFPENMPEAKPRQQPSEEKYDSIPTPLFFAPIINPNTNNIVNTTLSTVSLNADLDLPPGTEKELQEVNDDNRHKFI